LFILHYNRKRGEINMPEEEQKTEEPKLMLEVERRQLALDIMDGKIFATWNIKPSDGKDMIGAIFMPLALGAKLPKGVAHLYEYLSAAGPRSINGYPIFTSLRILLKEDAEAIFPMLAELEKQRKAFVNEEDKEEKDDDTSERTGSGDAEGDRERTVQRGEHGREHGQAKGGTGADSSS
jgi:hypothetical protein